MYGQSEISQIDCIDEIYMDLFGYKEDGFFIEFGAGDGHSYSNTSCLADLGWTGHYIEPLDELYQLCVNRHSKNKNVKCHNFAISDENGESKLYSHGFFSSLYKNFDKDELDGIVNVPTMTLDHFLTLQGVKPFFDILSTDTDGKDWDIFSVFDIRKWSPRCVIVEVDAKRSARFYSYFISNGYSQIFHDPDSFNNVYILDSCI